MSDAPYDRNRTVDQLAEALVAYGERVWQIVKEVPDEEIGALVAECRRLAQPNADCTVPMPEWDLLAGRVESEYTIRVLFRKAKAHEEATGEGIYCPHCGGSCTPEHVVELEYVSRTRS
jgi:hypothetical protein